MTNREAHEEAAGMPLDDLFFTFNGIDPDAECEDGIITYDKVYPTLQCEHCGILDKTVTVTRQRTFYEEESANWVVLCPKCCDDNDAYWEEMWAELHRGLL